jgi:Flp pilus assembly protein TadG
MQRGNGSLLRQFVGFAGERKGGVAVLTAMTLSSLVGFAGLGTEATMWYVAKRNMQGATDAAAYTAAIAETAGQTSTGFTAAAKAVTAQYGFTDGSNDIVVTVNNPPLSGNFTGDAQAVEVIISQPQNMLFSALFLSTKPTISSRAVAGPATKTTTSSGAADCVIALDKGNVTDLGDSGSTQLTLNTCSIAINSSSSSALNLSGSASINAQSANIVGNYVKSGSASFTTTNGITTGGTAVADPYASVNVPSYSGCNATNATVTSKVTYTPVNGVYVFCNGLRVAGTGNVTLNPGVYILNGGGLSTSGSTTITGTGVTIISTSSTGSSYGTFNISGSSTLNVTAPTTGATAGLAFFQDRNAPTSGTNSFSGGSNMGITGAIYFPSQGVTYSGSTGNAATPCTQLVANTITFSGSTTFNANCTGTGVLGMSTGTVTTYSGPPKLVE